MHIAIPLFPRFTALDIIGPYEVLRFLPDVSFSFVAAAPGTLRDGAGHVQLTAGVGFDDVVSCDLLLVPGGPGARQSLDDEVLLGWIRRMHDTARWTTSVCTGSLLLGAAGLLRGRTATTHWGAVETLESFGATYTEQRVVVADPIVTAAGVSAGIDMGLALAAEIAGPMAAQAIQLGIEYDPQPPFDAGSVTKAPQEAVDLLRAGLR